MNEDKEVEALSCVYNLMDHLEGA